MLKTITFDSFLLYSRHTMTLYKGVEYTVSYFKDSISTLMIIQRLTKYNQVLHVIQCEIHVSFHIMNNCYTLIILEMLFNLCI